MAGDREREQAGVDSLNEQVRDATAHLQAEEARRDELKAQSADHNLRVQALNDRLQALSAQVTECQTQAPERRFAHEAAARDAARLRGLQ